MQQRRQFGGCAGTEVDWWRQLRGRCRGQQVGHAFNALHEVVNFGCRLNIAEGEAIRTAVEAAGKPGTAARIAASALPCASKPGPAANRATKPVGSSAAMH